jgi:hypothetical protein
MKPCRRGCYRRAARLHTGVLPATRNCVGGGAVIGHGKGSRHPADRLALMNRLFNCPERRQSLLRVSRVRRWWERPPPDPFGGQPFRHQTGHQSGLIAPTDGLMNRRQRNADGWQAVVSRGSVAVALGAGCMIGSEPRSARALMVRIRWVRISGGTRTDWLRRPLLEMDR